MNEKRTIDQKKKWAREAARKLNDKRQAELDQETRLLKGAIDRYNRFIAGRDAELAASIEQLQRKYRGQEEEAA